MTRAFVPEEKLLRLRREGGGARKIPTRRRPASGRGCAEPARPGLPRGLVPSTRVRPVGSAGSAEELLGHVHEHLEIDVGSQQGGELRLGRELGRVDVCEAGRATRRPTPRRRSTLPEARSGTPSSPTTSPRSGADPERPGCGGRRQEAEGVGRSPSLGLYVRLCVRLGSLASPDRPPAHFRPKDAESPRGNYSTRAVASSGSVQTLCLSRFTLVRPKSWFA